jgi:putative endonuclease
MDKTQSIEKIENDYSENNWCVYILSSSDGKLYTGISNNMFLRWEKHIAQRGAKFFRGRRPIALLFQEPNHSRSSASKREHQIKQLSKKQKQQLIIQYYGPHHPLSFSLPAHKTTHTL